VTIRKTASFTVAEDRVGEALEAIRVFVSHAQSEPGTLVYESWRSAHRPTELLHFMAFADERAENAHRPSDAVEGFTDVLYPL
jgi:quinol monooxygenase YgiN